MLTAGRHPRACAVTATSLIALCPVSATYTLPSGSTAMPLGRKKPEEIVTVLPPAATHSLTALFFVSVKKRLPAASTATPRGPFNPETILLIVPFVRPAKGGATFRIESL